MLGPADIEAWREEAEAAAARDCATATPPQASREVGLRTLLAVPATLAYGEMLAWRRRLLGGGRR